MRPLILLLAIAANVLFWQYLGRPVELPDVPGGRFECLSYTPYAPGHDPTNPNDRVPEPIIAADLEALSAITGCLRLYSARGSSETVLQQARARELKVILGAWISGNREQDRAEMEHLIRLARAYPDVVSTAVIGNEVLLRRELPSDRLGALIAEGKRAIEVPVAYADVYDFWYQNPQMAQYVDTILVHILPYWGEPAPTSSAAQGELEQQLLAFIQAFPGKPILIGETGWPSAGPPRQQAEASIVDQARFVRSFIQSASKLGVPYNLIEAMDQPWKRASEGTAGGYWGVLDENRRPKFPLAGPVSEWPDWPWQAAGAALAGLLITLTIWRHPWSWRIPTAILTGQAIGTLLMAGLRHAGEVSLGWIGLLSNYGGVALIALAGVGLIGLLAAPAGALAGSQPVPLLDLFAWLRRPRRIPDPGLRLSLLLFAGAYPAAVITLSLAAAMRHQDIPWIYFIPSALLALTVTLRGLARSCRGRPEASLALILLGSAPFCFDGLDNEPALLWMGLALLLALPWLGALRPHPVRRIPQT